MVARKSRADAPYIDMIGYILISMATLAIGVTVGYLVRQNLAKKQLSTAEGQAARMVEEAGVKAQEVTLEAKNKAVQILEDAKKNEQANDSDFIHSYHFLSK